MKKRTKIILAVVAILLVVAAIVAAVGFVATLKQIRKNIDVNNQTTTTSVDATEESSTSYDTGVIQPPSQKEVEEESFEKVRICFCYKTESGFEEAEFTKHASTNLEEVKPFSLDIKKTEERERKFIQPEVRLYGVSLDANVTVTVESQATKAYKQKVGVNDGAYQYFYWQPKLYDASEQGEYTFKVTIRETKESAEEQVIYYKISV